MARHRLLGPVRFTLVAALLGALLVVSAGVVSAAASITATPGTASVVTGTTNSFAIPATSITADINVNCGATTAVCSVWIARNNAPKATEALFTNVTGSGSLIPASFINDGCFNFRLYDSAHGNLLGQMNIGHGQGGTDAGVVGVCDAAGAGSPLLFIDNGAGSESIGFTTGKTTSAPSETPDGFFDSGFSGGVETAEIWISQSKPGFAFTDCNAISYPNASEVLYTRNASAALTGLSLSGGGPFCFTMYQGTSHTTKLAFTFALSISSYLSYVGGTANPGHDPAQGTIYYSSGNGATNALVCVGGSSTGFTFIPFTFNSFGYGSAVASFQTANGGNTQNLYTLHVGVTGLDANGNATKASCSTGTAPRDLGSVAT